MAEYTTLVAAVALVLSAVVGLSQIFSLQDHIRKAKQPMVDDHEMLMEHERKLNNDNERLDDLKTGADKQAKVILQIANHLIEGDHDDELAKARNELQSYLISR